MIEPVNLTAEYANQLNGRYNECGICLEELTADAAQMTCCSHLFHRVCICRHVVSALSPKFTLPACPRCRAGWSPESHNNLFTRLKICAPRREAMYQREFESRRGSSMASLRTLADLPTDLAVGVLKEALRLSGFVLCDFECSQQAHSVRRSLERRAPSGQKSNVRLLLQQEVEVVSIAYWFGWLLHPQERGEVLSGRISSDRYPDLPILSWIPDFSPKLLRRMTSDDIGEDRKAAADIGIAKCLGATLATIPETDSVYSTYVSTLPPDGQQCTLMRARRAALVLRDRALRRMAFQVTKRLYATPSSQPEKGLLQGTLEP